MTDAERHELFLQLGEVFESVAAALASAFAAPAHRDVALLGFDRAAQSLRLARKTYAAATDPEAPRC